MGEIVSGVATAVLGKLGSEAYQQIAQACNLKSDVERLRNSMTIVSSFLMDAENKQDKKDSITQWLGQLRDAIYDASDILDEIEYEAKQNEVVKMYGRACKKVRRFFSCSNPLAFRIKIARKIKDIKERIDEKIDFGKNLGLVEQHANNKTPSQNLSWRETSSFVPPQVSGRDEEKGEIISSLMSTPAPSQSQVSDIDVIPIVGIGGLGKTTLAQMVFNDNRVVDHFDMRMWVCVSEEFDVKGLILKIIKAAEVRERLVSSQKIERVVDHNSSLDELQSQLHEKLHGKRFLLVLDDVWNENAKKWDDLKNHLLGAGGETKTNGSKIIVTTRNRNVAKIMGTVHPIYLKPLPEQQCWELFVKCAFSGKEEAEKHPRLKEIGEGIVNKCKGVPLAVVTLGCLLRSKMHDENEWKKIRESELWKIDRKDDGILPALRLSYDHLPSHLKRCFSYCSIFPKDYEFLSFQLISFWMAHGLLQPSNEKEEPEDLGELYIKKLVSASFLQVASEEEEGAIADALLLNAYRMHDLVHDLAMYTMKSEGVNGEVRHLTIPNNEDGVDPSPFPNHSKKIRTIRQPGDEATNTSNGELSAKWMISNEFKYLRVLDLTDSHFRLLPADCFAKVQHLRCLILSGCRNLEKLPDSICKLHLLESLFLHDCDKLQELPKNMRNLISLRHLHITMLATDLSSIDIGCFKFLQTLYLLGCENLVSLPRGMGRLTALKRLFIGGCEELAGFDDQGEEEEEDREQNKAVNDLSLQVFAIGGLPKLTALPYWLRRSSKTLQSLVIAEINVTALPEWLPYSTSLTTLYIIDCPLLLSLPNHMDRLRSLQYLHIEDSPKLIRGCKKDTGPEWPKIAHVPNLKLIPQPEEIEESEEMEESQEEES